MAEKTNSGQPGERLAASNASFTSSDAFDMSMRADLMWKIASSLVGYVKLMELCSSEFDMKFFGALEDAQKLEEEISSFLENK